MDDMNAFERQLADAMRQAGRPSRPVDADAIVRSASTATPVGRWSTVARRLRGDASSAPKKRGSSMLSAVKFVAAAAIVALFGGFLLTGVLTQQGDDEPLPAIGASASASPQTNPTTAATATSEASVTDDLRVTHVTGTLLNERFDDTEEESSVDDGIGRVRGLKSIRTIWWSDPRLPAEWVTVLNVDQYQIGVTKEVAWAGTSRLERPAGYWTGTAVGYFDQDGNAFGQDVLIGHGPYEGLFAIINARGWADLEREHESGFEGLIFEGQLPPMPEPVEPAAE